MTQESKARMFLDLHRPGSPLLLANAWDVGSARILEAAGFSALATTSSGFAASLGRLDGTVSRDEAITHAHDVAAATHLPVSADLENCFADDLAGVAETIRLSVAAGLAGGSIEDFTGRPHEPIYDLGLATERVAAAAEAAHRGQVHFVLTARTENYLHGRPDIADTIRRLGAFREAGADVVFAPGMVDLAEIQRTVDEVGLPVSVLARPNGPSVAELARARVSRISVGGSFAFVAYAAVVDAAAEWRERGTHGFLAGAGRGAKTAREAFASTASPRDDDIVDEQGDESFPASDPPSNWAGR